MRRGSSVTSSSRSPSEAIQRAGRRLRRQQARTRERTALQELLKNHRHTSPDRS